MRREQIQAILRATLPQVDPTFGTPHPYGGGVRGDANETLIFGRQLEYIFTRLYDVQYPDSMGRQIVPLDFSVPPGANSHTYRMIDEFGEAKLIDQGGYASEVPLVEGTGSETSQKIVGIVNGFFVSIQDLRAAAMAGIDVDTRKALTARRVMEQKLDSLLATGDSTVSMTGFANDANVTSSALSGLTGTWASATAATISADLELISKTIFVDTKGVYGNPDNGTQIDLVLPQSLYAIIASKRLDTYNETTILKYAQTQMPFIRSIRSWGRLDTAGASSVARIVAFHNHPDVVQGVIPQDFEIFPMQARSLGYMVPCHMRFGGVVVRYPKAMRYVDGC